MSKRKKTCEEEMNYLLNKVRKLERKVRRRDKNTVSDELPPSPQPLSPRPLSLLAPDSPPAYQTDTHVLEQTDWIPKAYDPETTICYEVAEEPQQSVEEVAINMTATQDEPSTSSIPQPQGGTADVTELDADALEILGEDPSVSQKRGNDILQELASRFQHIATEGLDKDTRKELITKYLIPANCLHIDAPKINPEIKVAIPENIAKREKGLEAKQKQMANAISCLGDIITTQINAKDKNKEMLQKLMDLGRLLCVIQYNDSITRRNFVLFSLKKDVKEHLSDTKIDSLLFGETLSDTLKSAKTIHKSGSELKADSSNKNSNKKSKPSTFKNLNRKAPGPAYRPPTQSARSYQPAAPRSQLPPLPPLMHSSNTWSRHTTAPVRCRY